MTVMPPELRRAKTAALWVGTVVPLALTLISTVIVALSLPRLPETVAVQFSFNGTPSNYGPSWMQLVLSLGVGGLLSLMSLAQTRKTGQKGQVWTRSHRFMPALMLGVVTMIQIMAVGTTLMQVDLSSADDIQNPTPVLLAAFLSWPVLTLIGYAVQPNVIIDAPASAVSAPLTLARGERVVWVGSTTLSGWALAIIGTVITVSLGFTIALLVLGNPNWWVPALLTVILSIAALLATVYRVRIDRTGLTARTPLGWPAFHVPANDIDQVSVGEIDPFGEFGGWGIRQAPGVFAVALKSGSGIRIRRKNGRMFVVTLDDAETAATVLATVAETSTK